MDKYKTLLKWINEANNIVFFGGAGVSTASGIKDFRSKDGLYNMKYKYPPEKILSHSFFINHTDEFYKFYKDKLNCLDKEPNICHKYLTKLEKTGKLKAIVTQNIDGLHEKAGSKNIYNLHGTIYENECMKCQKKYTEEDIFIKNITTCTCGGIIKPNVVLYEEPLDTNKTFWIKNEPRNNITAIVTMYKTFPLVDLNLSFGMKNNSTNKKIYTILRV